MTVAPAPTRGIEARQWRMLGAVVMLQAFTIGFAVYSFTLWVVPLMAEFGTGRGPILAGASIDGLMMAVMSPVAGYAADRVSPRWLLFGGLVSFAFGVLAMGWVTQLWQMWVIYGTLVPLGAGLAGPVVCQTLVARSFKTSRGLALGISSAGTALGGLILPPIIAALVGGIGWRGAHMAIALCAFVLIAPLVWLAVPDARPTVAAGAAKPERGSYWRLLANGQLWIIIATFIPIGIVFASVQFNLGPLAKDRTMSLEMAGLVLSTLAISMISGKLLFGSLADRMKHRRLYYVDAAILAIAIACVTLTGTAAGLFLGVVFLGIAGGGFYPLISAIVAGSFPAAQFGQALGLCFLFLNASLVGPSIAAAARDVTGSYATALQLMLLLLIPAAGLILLLRGQRDRSDITAKREILPKRVLKLER